MLDAFEDSNQRTLPGHFKNVNTNIYYINVAIYKNNLESVRLINKLESYLRGS